VLNLNARKRILHQLKVRFSCCSFVPEIVDTATRGAEQKVKVTITVKIRKGGGGVASAREFQQRIV
jgi:hypothetical protein